MGKHLQPLQSLQGEFQKTQRWVQYVNDMNRLYHNKHIKTLKDKQFEWDKIQELAYKKGNPNIKYEDWESLYDEAYRDDLIQLETERKLQEMRSAEDERRKSEGVSMNTGSPSSGRIFRLPDGIPASREEASEGALNILREERAKRGE